MRKLNRHRSAIFSEIKRGSIKQVKDVSGKFVYYNEIAQRLTEKRRKTVYFLKLEQVTTNFLTSFTEVMVAKQRIHSIETFIYSYKKVHPDKAVSSTKTMYIYTHQGLLAVELIDSPCACV